MACVRSAITGRAPCSATTRAIAASSAGRTWNPGAVWNRFGLISTSAPAGSPDSGPPSSARSRSRPAGTPASSPTAVRATCSVIRVLHGDDACRGGLGAGDLGRQRDQLDDLLGQLVHVGDVL